MKEKLQTMVTSREEEAAKNNDRGPPWAACGALDLARFGGVSARPYMCHGAVLSQCTVPRRVFRN